MSDPPPRSDRAYSAYHEVGHEIACDWAGYPVTFTEIDGWPICRYQSPAWDQETVGVDGGLTAGGSRHLVIAVAGRLSEYIAHDPTAPPASFEEELGELFDRLDSGIQLDEVIFETDLDDSDIAAIFKMLAPFGRQQADEHLREAEAEAEACSVANGRRSSAASRSF
jgi:hypothetical protein